MLVQGPAGVGKTRLVAQTSAALRVDFLIHPPEQIFVAIPDSGTSRTLDELCRELAP